MIQRKKASWHRNFNFNDFRIIISGVFGLILNGWLFATFIHSHVLIFRSHILVLNLCTGSLGRNLMGFPFAGPSALSKRYKNIFLYLMFRNY